MFLIEYEKMVLIAFKTDIIMHSIRTVIKHLNIIRSNFSLRIAFTFIAAWLSIGIKKHLKNYMK